MLNQIGTFTVDQSATGRLQQTWKGVQVRDVLGQPLVLYAQGGAQNTLPPNLDPTTDAQAETAAGDRVGRSPTVNSQGGVSQRQRTSAVNENFAGHNGVAGPIPVAAGIIRLMNDRRPVTTPQTAPVDGNTLP